MTVSRLELVALGLLACVACASCLAPSIDNEPVKVTHRNSGPRYDIDSNANDEPERVPLTPTGAVQQSGGARGEESARPDEPAGESGDQMPIGHVSIRRIFLVPMMRPARGDWPEEANGGGGEQQTPQARPAPAAGDDDNERAQAPAMFAKPFWPFLTPARPVHHPHLFGADEASRSPAAAARPDQERAESASGAGEREGDEPQTKSLRSWLKHRRVPVLPTSESMDLPEQRPVFMMRRPAGEQPEPQPLVDPIQMLMEMMQQAFGGQLAPPGGKPTDETAAPSEERPKMPAAEGETAAEAGDKSPALRPTNNEKREDIVEIDGKKYLRKTVINRHVGENIIFMTKRLIFVPLNETSGEAAENAPSEQPAIPTSAATVSSTGSSTTTTVAPTNNEETTTAASPAPVKPAEEATTTVATNVPTTTTSTAGEPASTTEQAASSTAAAATEESLAARAAKALERAAERLVEKAEGLAEGASSSTTAAPAPSTDKPASV